ncbi:ribosome biogenesis protein SLX9 homolog isoform X6 [Calonectris borealis]|uniref:ribosome biogenesis protein SLX9 homolog isoform X6 n=1 Tax=Calonectris borealis TaxID=1323832 RepID=UPI003F4C277E
MAINPPGCPLCHHYASELTAAERAGAAAEALPGLCPCRGGEGGGRGRGPQPRRARCSLLPQPSRDLAVPAGKARPSGGGPGAGEARQRPARPLPPRSAAPPAMVGKAKRPRLHRAAPRPWPARDPPPLPEPGPGPGLGPGAGGWSAAAGKDWDFSSSGVFSGLKIDPDTLVKKLDLDSRSIISSRTGWQYPNPQTSEVEQPS